jgi:hypothetical protein
MPPRRNNKKKKSKSESAVTCAQCSVKVKSSTSIKCICTRVVFCSDACKELALAPSGRHSCTGPPDQVVNINQRLRDLQTNPDSVFRDPSQAQAWDEEYRRTITAPMTATIMRDGVSSARVTMQDLSINQSVRFADQGDAAFAYLAGIRFKNRMLGAMEFRPDGGLVSNNTEQGHQLGVLETDELAFKYLSQAAEGNIALAMQSLADCYENGTGVKKSMRMCREWLWRASLLHSAGALPILENKSVLQNELFAQCQMLEHSPMLRPGQGMSLGGPNVGCLLVALHQPLSEQGYMLPAFASEAPTLRVGDRPCQGTTGAVAIIAMDSLKKVVIGMDQMVRKGIEVVPIYGRRGVGKAATAQTYGAASRPLDSLRFVVPPAPGCDETPTDDEVQRWRGAAAIGSLVANRYGNPRNLKSRACTTIREVLNACNASLTPASA